MANPSNSAETTPSIGGNMNSISENHQAVKERFRGNVDIG
jgi:hypothetical protein